MKDITCPFKYSDTHIYCKCPHRKGDIDLSQTLSLDYAWIMHLRELKDNGDDWEGIALANKENNESD